MLGALAEHAPRRWDSALAIAPQVPSDPWPSTRWMTGAHPVPDGRSETAGNEALRLARQLGPEDLLLVLLSGGASALMAVPAPGLALDDKRSVQRVLLRTGADIGEMNAVRKHLSAIKGGRLAAATRARVLTLAVSDVVGDALQTIGSGPTVADPTTFADALSVLERRGGLAAFPERVVSHLERGVRGEGAETPKVMRQDVHARVIASVLDALDAAAAEAAMLGYRVHRIAAPVTGEARGAGPRLLGEAMRVAERGRPCCVISGGETTVTVQGEGTGGRNQELALSMAMGLEGQGAVVVASIGTDGIDGPTDAAGAVVDSTTAERARALGLEPQIFLSANNSYAFFGALGDLVRTGPTGTNVGDIQIVMMSSEGMMAS